MNKEILLKSQKNQIFNIIQSRGLTTFNFEWKYSKLDADSTYQAPCLLYKDTNYYFVFDYLENMSSYAIRYSPCDDKPFFYDFGMNWNSIYQHVDSWVYYLKREVEEPNLWEEINKYSELGGIQYKIEKENELFNIQQAHQITVGIDNIRAYLLETVIIEEDINEINKKLDSVVEKLNTMGKVDWMNQFVGTVINLSMSLMLNPEQGNAIMSIFKSALNGIIKLIG